MKYFCSPHTEQLGSEGNLLRMLQQQLLQSDNPLDTEQLRAAFSKADRSHRLTLSQSQVYQPQAHLNVPPVCSKNKQPFCACVPNTSLHGFTLFSIANFLQFNNMWFILILQITAEQANNVRYKFIMALNKSLELLSLYYLNFYLFSTTFFR